MNVNLLKHTSFQASFNYPSRQPSFKQNSSEADSQPDLLQPTASGGGHSLGVPVPLRTSLTPPDRVYVTSDEVQDIYTEVPPEWPPLPPVPPHHQQNMQKDQDCVEISQEELERQVSLWDFGKMKIIQS